MTRTARFCKGLSLPILKPHDNIQKWKCGRMDVLYNVRGTEMGIIFCSRRRMPIVREVFFATFWTCGFQLKCSSRVRPKKLNSETCSIGSESNFRSGVRVSILRCWWWKLINLVLLTLTDNLFISSHSCTRESSSLMLFVTSVKLVGFSEFDELNDMGLRRFVSSAWRIALEFNVATCI